MCSDNKNSNSVSFGLGALLGAGAGFFLSTKKGRKLVKQAWKQIEPYVDDAVDTAKDEFEEVKGKARIKADEIKQKAGELKSQAEVKMRTFQERAEDLKTRAEETLDDVEDRATDIKKRAEIFRSKAEDFKVKAEDEVDRRVSQIKDLADEKLPPSLKKPVKRTFFKGV